MRSRLALAEKDTALIDGIIAHELQVGCYERDLNGEISATVWVVPVDGQRLDSTDLRSVLRAAIGEDSASARPTEGGQPTCEHCGDPLEPFEDLVGVHDGEPAYRASAICINEQCPRLAEGGQ